MLFWGNCYWVLSGRRHFSDVCFHVSTTGEQTGTTCSSWSWREYPLVGFVHMISTVPTRMHLLTLVEASCLFHGWDGRFSQQLERTSYSNAKNKTKCATNSISTTLSPKPWWRSTWSSRVGTLVVILSPPLPISETVWQASGDQGGFSRVLPLRIYELRPEYFVSSMELYPQFCPCFTRLGWQGRHNRLWESSKCFEVHSSCTFSLEI